MQDSNIPVARWIIDGLIAIGTVGAVIVALFGQAFRKKFFPPKLRLTCREPFGAVTPIRLTTPSAGEGLTGRSRIEDGRYCTVVASNARRWSEATEVRISLVQVEEFGLDGNPYITWTGNLPLEWQHQQLFPPARIVGPDATADLFNIVKDKGLNIRVQLVPFNLDVWRTPPINLILTVQAFATESNSEPLRLRVTWDGVWHSGTQEMSAHLQVAKL